MKERATLETTSTYNENDDDEVMMVHLFFDGLVLWCLGYIVTGMKLVYGAWITENCLLYGVFGFNPVWKASKIGLGGSIDVLGI